MLGSNFSYNDGKVSVELTSVFDFIINNGFDKYNSNVVSIKRFRANNVIVTESINNLTMDNNGINFTPQEAVKHEIIILKVK